MKTKNFFKCFKLYPSTVTATGLVPVSQHMHAVRLMCWPSAYRLFFR